MKGHKRLFSVSSCFNASSTRVDGNLRTLGGAEEKVRQTTNCIRPQKLAGAGVAARGLVDENI
jgi:hypothetical protein